MSWLHFSSFLQIVDWRSNLFSLENGLVPSRLCKMANGCDGVIKNKWWWKWRKGRFTIPVRMSHSWIVLDPWMTSGSCMTENSARLSDPPSCVPDCSPCYVSHRASPTDASPLPDDVSSLGDCAFPTIGSSQLIDSYLPDESLPLPFCLPLVLWASPLIHFTSFVHRSSIMSLHPVTRFVLRLGALHDVVALVQNGGMGVVWQMTRQAFYSPQHFPKFLGTAMVGSGVAGYTFMGYLRQPTMVRFWNICACPIRHNSNVFWANEKAIDVTSVRTFHWSSLSLFEFLFFIGVWGINVACFAMKERRRMLVEDYLCLPASEVRACKRGKTGAVPSGVRR
jgi:hypothetical protein